MDHIPSLEYHDKHSDLEAFEICTRLYILADFLGMETLCCELIRRLVRFVNYRAHYIEPYRRGMNLWFPTDYWTSRFIDCVKAAYEMLPHDKRLRKPFVLFMTYTKTCSGTGSR